MLDYEFFQKIRNIIINILTPKEKIFFSPKTMSFFDLHFPCASSKKHELFNKVTNENKSVFDKCHHFTLSGIYPKKNGSNIAAVIKIIEAKIVIFKV